MRLKTLLSLIVVPVLFAGCGGGTSENGSGSSGVSKLSASQSCMSQSCHGAATSPGTGLVIAEEWKASSHNLQNGAGCADCHDPDSGHPQACSKCHGGGSGSVTKNPDLAGKCNKCHGPSYPGDVQMALAPQHYGYSSARIVGSGTRASYVSGQYVGHCRACHNPHNNTLTQNHRDWAKSLHGDTKGVAWTHYDFKGMPACIRCHTTTGYVSFVTSNFTVPTQGFGSGDSTREVLGCNACHASYDFKNSIRNVPAFTGFYKNFNGTAATFPDVGRSNLCIPCHSGRDSGESINAITDFSNVGFINSHYLAAAGLMYMQIGFINFTSFDAAVPGSTYGTYGKSLTPDNISTPGGVAGGTKSTHRTFGTSLINNDFHNTSFFVPGVMDKNGPCVTCHLNAYGTSSRPGSGHTLKIDANAYNQVCINCHTSENAVPLNASNFKTVFLKPQAEAFETSLKLIQELLLNKYKISYDESAHPYFYDENLPLVKGKKQAVKDWTRGGTVNGRKLMGACFNMQVLTRDPAAYAHARSYSRRLIYDSIDFLDDGKMNMSVGETAKASTVMVNSKPAFVKDSQAYNTSGSSITTIYGNTSEAMLYLLNWSRSTGSWNIPERP